MTPEERATEIVAKHWHLLQGTRARAKAALVAEIATEINAGQMDQAVTDKPPPLIERQRAEIERLKAENGGLRAENERLEAAMEYALRTEPKP